MHLLICQKHAFVKIVAMQPCAKRACRNGVVINTSSRQIKALPQQHVAVMPLWLTPKRYAIVKLINHHFLPNPDTLIKHTIAGPNWIIPSARW